MALILIIAVFGSTAGCLDDSGLEERWNDVSSAVAVHRFAVDDYLLVYTIGIDLWNVELDSESPNIRHLRTQIAREEAFLDDVFEKHRRLTLSVAAFTDYARELEGNRGVWATEIAWELRIYDEEMWNAQSALKGRLSSLQQYLDLAYEGAGTTPEAIAYLESANALSRDAAGAISRADAARASAESRYTDSPFPKVHLL